LTWRKLETMPLNPQNIRSVRSISSVVIDWSRPGEPSKNPARFYAIYRFTDRDIISNNKGMHLIGLVPSSTTQFIDNKPLKENTSYLITSIGIDRQESDGVSVFVTFSQ